MSIHFDTKHIAAAIAKKRRSSQINKKSAANPEMAWLIACISFMGFFFLSAGVSVMWYQYMRSLPTNAESTYQTIIPQYSAILVDEVHREFEARTKMFNDTINQTNVGRGVVRSDDEVSNDIDNQEEDEAVDSVTDEADGAERNIEIQEVADDSLEIEEDTPDMTGVSPEF